MRLHALCSALFALSACTASRPDGAFTPTDNTPDFQEPPDEPDASDDGMPPDEDASIDEPVEDADTAVPVDPENPLSVYVGKYLMRMDYFSSASKTQSGNTLSLKNRVSNLFFTTVELVDGELRASEQLCFQSYEHACEKGCNGWTTTVDPRLNSNAAFFPAQKLERVYTVDAAGKLTAPARKLALGYTPSDDANASSLPASPSDARVWQLKAPADNKTAAVLTRVKATLVAQVPVPGVTVGLDCLIDVVQLFESAFEGTAASLAGKTFRIDATGSDLKAILAAPTSGNSDPYCTLDQLGPSSDDAEPEGYVRFKAAGKYTGCPATASEYENTAFKVSIDPPTL